LGFAIFAPIAAGSATHRSQSAGSNITFGLVVLIELCRHHLMLPHIGYNNALPLVFESKSITKSILSSSENSFSLFSESTFNSFSFA
jgi:hypothetical protein